MTVDTLTKQPGETDLLMDLPMSGKMRKGDTIISVKPLSILPTGDPDDLTATGETHDGNQTVQARFSKGRDGIVYIITAKVNTAGGEIDVEEEGSLYVNEQP